MYKVVKLNNIPYTFHDYASLDAFIAAGMDQSKGHPDNKIVRNAVNSNNQSGKNWLGVEGGQEGWRQYVREGAQKEQKRIADLVEKFQTENPKRYSHQAPFHPWPAGR